MTTDNSRVDDGGPAFPGSSAFSPKGLSIRDWFAGQVIIGLATYAATKGYTDSDMASDAYRLADAMLAARKGGDQ